MIPYKVLCTYKPSRWRASVVGRELTQITAELGLTPHVDPAHGPLPLTGRNWVSVPLHAEVRRRTFKTNMAEGPHFDGDTTPGSKPDCALVLWASNNATELKWRNYLGNDCFIDGKIYQPKPYELVIFHNLHCLHWRPKGVPRVRWIFRQRVAVPKHMELP